MTSKVRVLPSAPILSPLDPANAPCYLGTSSPYIDSAVILLNTSGSYEEAVAGCEALSEELWSPTNSTVSIQSSLDYLVYEGRAAAQSLFWVASTQGGTRQTISASGQVSAANASQGLPALCTQSAPLATSSKTDNGSAWQVSVRSNNEDLVGWVASPRPSSAGREDLGTCG